MTKLSVATCQFPVTGNPQKNAEHATAQIRRSAERGARLVHFSETALSGYAGVDLPSFEGYDWDLLESCTRDVMRAARECGVWVVIGSSHRLSAGNKPYNCVYVIDDSGALVDRYDKRFCTGGDLVHYSPGSHFCTFSVFGIRCGVLVCYDFRFQELYREYKRLGVQLMLHSYHNAGRDKRELRRRGNIWGHIVPATMYAYAANNYMWISANNSSRAESCWPSFFVTPDGREAGRLRNNCTGVLINIIDTGQEFYDAPGDNRERAMNGQFNSGETVEDPRSEARADL